MTVFLLQPLNARVRLGISSDVQQEFFSVLLDILLEQCGKDTAEHLLNLGVRACT